MKEQLVNDMARDLCHLDRPCASCLLKSTCKARVYARRAVYCGYRREEDVAKKIFEEIRQEVHLALEAGYKAKRDRLLRPGNTDLIDGKIAALRGVAEYLEHIEQKYVEVE